MDSPELDDPFLKFWDDDPKKKVSFDTLVPVLAAWVECANERFWKAAGDEHGSPNWYNSRRKGLKAFANYEATFRLKQYRKREFTLDDYMEFHLHEKIGVRGPAAIADDFYADYIDHRRRCAGGDGGEFITQLGGAIKRTGRSANPEIKAYALFFDVAMVPLEFWTNDSAAEFLSAILGSSVTRDQIKMWKREQLKLKETKPFIVSKYSRVSKSIQRLNPEAIRHHGLPMPDESELNAVPLHSKAKW